MANATTKKAYLTKRRMDSASKKGIQEAIDRAMATSGSIVAVSEGWVIRKFEDGRVEKIEKLEKTPKADIVEQVSKLAGD